LYAWLLSIIVSTAYTFIWDVLRDWGLWQSDSGYLRKKLIFKKPVIYYFAMVANLFMRLMWTFTISPESLGIVMSELTFASILAIVEIIRRAMWNLFRVENEQLNNVGKFRAVNVQVPPTEQESIGHALTPPLKTVSITQTTSMPHDLDHYQQQCDNDPKETDHLISDTDSSSSPSRTSLELHVITDRSPSEE
jgi:hypothetical protein